MRQEFFGPQLLKRLSDVRVADADPIPVIISFQRLDTRTEFAVAASAPHSLIERYALAVSDAVAASLVSVAAVGSQPREHRSINAVSVALPVGVLKALSDRAETVGLSPGGIELDFHVTIALNRVVPHIGASTVHDLGVTGAGITVAIVDTGVDGSHEDLRRRIAKARDFTGEGAGDQNGHGTHVAGIVAGEGRLLGGKYRGVAPGARLLDVKVLGRNGGGSASTVVTGIEWLVDEGVQVANISIEGPASDGTDPLSRAADWAIDQGVVVCVAAGNHGPAPGTIGSPGAAVKAITVGALDNDDAVADYSARGRTGDKPTLVMPGSVVSAKPAGLTSGTTVDGDYRLDTGTSMAAPQIAGACALLLELAPSMTIDGLRDVLARTAVDVGASRATQGAGRADVARAVAELRGQTPGTDPPSSDVSAVRIAAVNPEVGLTERSIGRVRIALLNTSTGALSAVRSELRVDVPEVRILTSRGDYGVLAPGEQDDATHLVEYGTVPAGQVPFRLVVDYRRDGALRTETLDGHLPVRPAVGATGSESDLLARFYQRYPQLQTVPALTRFVGGQGVEAWGEAPLGGYAFLVGRDGRSFLLLPSNPQDAASPVDSADLGLTVGRDDAIGIAQRQGRTALGLHQMPEPTAVFPSLGNDDGPVWVVDVAGFRQSLRHFLRVIVNGRNGTVMEAQEMAVSMA